MIVECAPIEISQTYGASTINIIPSPASQYLSGCELAEGYVFVILINATLHVNQKPVFSDKFSDEPHIHPSGAGWLIYPGYYIFRSLGLKYRQCACWTSASAISTDDKASTYICYQHSSEYTGSSYLVLAHRDAMVYHLDEKDRKFLLSLGFGIEPTNTFNSLPMCNSGTTRVATSNDESKTANSKSKKVKSNDDVIDDNE